MSKSDISAYRVLRNHVFDAAKPLVLVTDRENRLVSYKGDADHYGLAEIKTGENCEDHLQFLVGADCSSAMDLPFYHCDNGKIAHIVLMPHDGQLLTLFMDATNAHEQEQELQQKRNEGLIQAERQDRLVKDLVKARELLEEKNRIIISANESKARFIADMSHEIRTPITSILGYTGLLKNEIGDQQYMRMADAIERSGRNILTLVENLRDHMQMELSEIKLKLYAVSINELLDDISSIFLPVARHKKIELNFSHESLPLNKIKIDELRVRQVLVNVLNNALKFTDRGSVKVHTRWYEQKLEFSIRDTGPGIPLSLQKTIFSPQGQKNEHKPAGVGLGLIIVKQLTDLMGGIVGLDSTPGIGSTFTLLVPAEEVLPDRSDDNYLHENDAINESHILVIDNDLDIGELYKLVLTRAGFKITTCQTAGEGIDIAVEQNPDLTLIDMNLSDVQSADAIRQMRQKGYSPPILAQTVESREVSRLIFESGANGFLGKPVKMTDLIETIQAYLGPIQTDDSSITIRTQLRSSFSEYLRDKNQLLRNEVKHLNNFSDEDYISLKENVRHLGQSSAFYGYEAVANAASNTEQSIKELIDGGGDKNQQRQIIINNLRILYSEILYCVED